MAIPEIRSATVAEIMAAPNLAAMLAEYADEARLVGLPLPTPQWEIYKVLEASGSFHVAAAFDGAELVGMLSFFVNTLPKYGVKAGVSEAFFVSAVYREHGVGLALLAHAEKQAKAAGAQGMLLSAPIGGQLAEVLPKIAYAECARAFFKALT